MSNDWYKADRVRIIKDGLVEKIVISSVARSYIEIYGTWTQEDGTQSEIQLLDWAKRTDQCKLPPKTWLRQVIIWDVYYKKGDWFSRQYKAVRSTTVIKNNETDMWERLELS